MQNMTDSPMLRTGGFPPPPPSRPVAPPNQINQAPRLPTVVAAVPSPGGATAPTANPFATSMNPTPPPGAPRATSNGGFRRFVSWMLVLGVIGGLAYAGIVYGPELMERATGEEDVPDEAAAALVFPTATLATPVVRTATYTVEQTDEAGEVEQYTVTADFESGVTQVTIDRGEQPDLEVLSFLGDSVIRRIDEANWWSLPRGEFPVDTSAGRIRWVRTLDEAIPATIRPWVTIERATQSSIANEPTTRLLVSIDPNRLTPPPATAPAATVPAADPAAAAVEPDPAADPAATPAPAVAEPVSQLPAGMTLVPGSDLSVPIEIELWVDSTGLVRKMVLPAQLGGETITVTAVSSDAFQPQFPAIEVIQPMSAAALYHLGR